MDQNVLKKKNKTPHLEYYVKKTVTGMAEMSREDIRQTLRTQFKDLIRIGTNSVLGITVPRETLHFGLLKYSNDILQMWPLRALFSHK